MGWVTTLGADMAQVNYRLEQSAGCATDVQADYRLAIQQATLEWVGSGLTEHGLTPGAALENEVDFAAARALMDGRSPATDEQLVSLKRAVDPRAKLSAKTMVDLIHSVAADDGVNPEFYFEGKSKAAADWRRMTRGVARSEERYRVPVTILDRVARAAGVAVDVAYNDEEVATARAFADERIVVGNRGYDLTVDVPKSFSVLHALADEDLAVKLDSAFRDSMRETVAAVEEWTGWAQRGHHGDGANAERVATTGMSGWAMIHYTARPVDGATPDPHLHAHISLANMVRGTDGQWSAVAAGGRDLHRHARAANEYMEAHLRAKTAELGVRWQRDPTTKAWEVKGVDQDVREVFSKRHGQIAAAVDAEMSRAQNKTLGAHTAEGRGEALALADLKGDWRAQSEAAGIDVDHLLAKATDSPAFEGTPVYDPAQIAAAVFDPDHGLTAHAKTFTHADLLAAVAAECRYGLGHRVDLEALTNEVAEHVVELDHGLPGTLSNAARYTTPDLIAAELDLLEYAVEGRDAARHARVAPGTIEAAIEVAETAAGFSLAEEQRAMVRRVTSSGYAIETTLGGAGTGKTTALRAVAIAHAAQGHIVAGSSTAAVAAHQLQTEAGIPSATLASWLKRIEDGRGLTGIDVLVVDESAMVDDRQLARLATAAENSGTQILAVGDPAQLRSPGVGSVFEDLHRIVDGPELLDNRRQQSETEKRALASWRDDDRRAILDTLAGTGRLHVEDTTEATNAAMIGSWWATQQTISDPHDRIKNHLMMAATNADVADLNHAAQAIRADAAEIDPATGRDFRIEGGQHLRLHAGDIVATRANNYSLDVLNGYRGIVTGHDTNNDTVTLQFRLPGEDGDELTTRTVPGDYVRGGGVELGYAITVHRAQGQTAETVTANLTGLDPHGAYPALTRHKDRVDAWLTTDVLESEETRLRLGPARDDTERLDRAIEAYTAYLDRPEPDALAIAYLERYRDRLAHRHVDAEATEARPPRRYAHYTTADLVTALNNTEVQRRQGEKTLERAQNQHATWQRAAEAAAEKRAHAEAGNGPNARELKTIHTRLERANDLLADIEGFHRAEGHAQENKRQAYTESAHHSRRTQDNPIKLRLQGTSRAEQHQLQQAAQARAQGQTAEAARLQQHLREANTELRTTLNDLPGRERYHRADGIRADYKGLTTRWETHYRAAIEDDLKPIRDPRPPKVSPEEAHQALTSTRQDRADLTAEVEAREQDEPGSRDGIMAERLHQGRQRAEAARVERERAQAQQRARDDERRRQFFDPGLGHSPGLGRDGPNPGGLSR